MKVGLGTVSLNIVLSIILAHFMGLKGVVLATAIANTLTCLVTLYIFNRTKAMIHFGVYVVLVVIFRDEMALEVIQMGTELLRRKS